MEYETLDFENFDPDSLDGALVRQSNELIEAKYQLPSVQEQRIILMLLAQIKPSDEDFKGYRISVSDFAKVAGIKADGVYTELERTTKALVSRTVTFKQGRDFLHVNWLSSAKYKHGSGYVELCFDPNMKPYLLQLKNHFTQYKLDKVLHFKSVYSIRLYELLKKEAWKARNSEFKLEISYEELREKFDIAKKEYIKFNDFKRFTIQPAVLEISEKSDLNIHNVNYKKTGRAISHIAFSVQVRSDDETKLRKNQTALEIISKPLENHPIIDSLVNMGIAWENAKSLKNKYGVKRVERNIAYVQGEVKSGKNPIERVPAYLTKAIREDWGKATEDKKERDEAKRRQEQEAKEREERENERKKEEQRKQTEQAINAFFGLPVGIKNHIQEEFAKVLKSEKKYSHLVPKWEVLKSEKEALMDEPMLGYVFAKFLVEKRFV